MVDTVVDWLSVSGTLWDGLLSVTSSNSDSVDDESLLGSVSQSSGLVWSGRSRSSVDDVELSVLPAPGGDEIKRGKSGQKDIHRGRSIEVCRLGFLPFLQTDSSICRAAGMLEILTALVSLLSVCLVISSLELHCQKQRRASEAEPRL